MSDEVYSALIAGVLVAASFLVAKWVNRHADKEDNGGHHQQRQLDELGPQRIN